MFGSLGGPEVLLIFVLALLLFGPRKLPEIGRMLGRSVAEFRKATNEFRSTLEREVQVEELKEIRSVGADLMNVKEEAATIAREAARLPAATLFPPSGAKSAPSGAGTTEISSGEPAPTHAGDPREP
jgi:TatA/E family protein of Tat protein translocase